MSEEYISGVLERFGERGTAISAAAARELTVKKQKNHTLNYNIMIKSVFQYIRDAAKGHSTLEVVVPAQVDGGTVGDPILLARQVKAKLTADDLGYVVERDGDRLTISWA
ncbi:unnamed protein product [Durusdinium trenchii]|uniref:Uncharacterized protein n=1 Tax=Durusdinium trenchii TaxID=1381693 RepID=A0ABP0S0B8_9DINO